jgi:hydrogenase-4 membrane subunit HyfE
LRKAFGRYALSLLGASVVAGLLLSTQWGFLWEWTFLLVLPSLAFVTGPPLLLLLLGERSGRVQVGSRRSAFLVAAVISFLWCLILYAVIAASGSLSSESPASVPNALGFALVLALFGAIVAGPALPVRSLPGESAAVHPR